MMFDYKATSRRAVSDTRHYNDSEGESNSHRNRTITIACEREIDCGVSVCLAF